MSSARAITAEFDTPRQLVVFDGDCPLCRRAVHALIAREARPQTGLVTLQSRLGHRLGEHFGENADDPDSMWLIRDGCLHRDSEGLWRCAEGLKRPWSLLARLRHLPRRWRDGVYRLIGRHRRRLATDPGLAGVVRQRLFEALDAKSCRCLGLPEALAEAHQRCAHTRGEGESRP